jgi:hypothetical protein
MIKSTYARKLVLPFGCCIHPIPRRARIRGTLQMTSLTSLTSLKRCKPLICMTSPRTPEQVWTSLFAFETSLTSL